MFVGLLINYVLNENYEDSLRAFQALTIWWPNLKNTPLIPMHVEA